MELVILIVALVVLAGVGLWAMRAHRQPQCADCKAWNLAKGQAAIDENPVFKAASTMLPPAVMGSQVDEAGNRLPNGVPDECAWEEFGACKTHNELRWARDKCPKFERQSLREARQARAQLVQLRKAREKATLLPPAGGPFV